MNEIKFRAWHKGNGRFEYATLFDFLKNGFQVCEAAKPYNNMPCTKQKVFVDDGYLHNFLKECFYGEAKWQPYIGLKDINGKEIYKGDIVQVFCFDGQGFRHTVVYENGAFGYRTEFQFIPFAGNYNFNWKNSQSDQIMVVGSIKEATHEQGNQPEQ